MNISAINNEDFIKKIELAKSIKAETPKPSKRNKDSVTISGYALELEKTNKEVDFEDFARIKHIEELKKAIQQGRYKISEYMLDMIVESLMLIL